MSFRLFLAIVRSRFLLVLLTFLVTLASGVYLTHEQPRRYVASTFLVFNLVEDNPFDRTVIPAQLSSSYLATQLDIIRSPKVALKVVEILGLENDNVATAAYSKTISEHVSLKEWLAAGLIDGLHVDPLNNSRVVNLSYEALDPRQAAKIANAYAEAFVATTLELTMEPARRNAEWFDEQRKMLRERLDAARARLTEFELEKGIVALDEKLGAESSRLDDISKNLVQAQSETYDVRSRQLGVNHPEYLRAIQRENALYRSLDEQKRRVLEIKGHRDELDARAREVEVEEQNYASTLQNFYKTAMESQFNQTNIAILSPATPPLQPSSPNVRLNIASALVLGLILGFLAAVLAEIINPKISPQPGIDKGGARSNDSGETAHPTVPTGGTAEIRRAKAGSHAATGVAGPAPPGFSLPSATSGAPKGGQFPRPA